MTKYGKDGTPIKSIGDNHIVKKYKPNTTKSSFQPCFTQHNTKVQHFPKSHFGSISDNLFDKGTKMATSVGSSILGKVHAFKTPKSVNVGGISKIRKIKNTYKKSTKQAKGIVDFLKKGK